MFVTTATVGDNMRKLPSLSSASATSSLPWPSRALVPSARSLPPITTVGSSPARASTSAMNEAASSIAATSEVVVVLPCVPATAMPNFMRISSASISARAITGMRSSRARATSGFAILTAEEMTTTSMPAPTLPGSWPMATAAPKRVKRRVVSDSARSEPLTT